MNETDIKYLESLFSSEGSRQKFAALFDERIEKLSNLKFLNEWIKTKKDYNKGPTIEMVFHAADIATMLLEEFKNDILHFRNSDEEIKKERIPV